VFGLEGIQLFERVAVSNNSKNDLMLSKFLVCSTGTRNRGGSYELIDFPISRIHGLLDPIWRELSTNSNTEYSNSRLQPHSRYSHLEWGWTVLVMVTANVFHVLEDGVVEYWPGHFNIFTENKHWLNHTIGSRVCPDGKNLPYTFSPSFCRCLLMRHHLSADLSQSRTTNKFEGRRFIRLSYACDCTMSNIMCRLLQNTSHLKPSVILMTVKTHSLPNPVLFWCGDKQKLCIQFCSGVRLGIALL
jgi:hypothetical protein